MAPFSAELDHLLFVLGPGGVAARAMEFFKKRIDEVVLQLVRRPLLLEEVVAEWALDAPPAEEASPLLQAGSAELALPLHSRVEWQLDLPFEVAPQLFVSEQLAPLAPHALRRPHWLRAGVEEPLHAPLPPVVLPVAELPARPPRWPHHEPLHQPVELLEPLLP